MPKATVIIVNYNCGGVIIQCLESLSSQSFRDFHVVIVDNASSDGSVAEIERFLGGCFLSQKSQIVKLRDNPGFAGGNGEGLRLAEGEYIALLNPDTIADTQWLGELVDMMDRHPDAGICGSNMIVLGTNNIERACDGFSRVMKGLKRGEGKGKENYNEPEPVFGACAGAALYRRRMLDEIGFFDEDFFLIQEDTDLNFRAQLAGWKVFYVPTAVAHHKVRSSIGHMSDIAVYYTLRNSEFVRIKDVPFSVFVRCFPEFVFGEFLDFVYFALKHRKPSVYLRAKRDAIRGMGGMLRKRREVMSKKRVDDRHIYRMMTPVWHGELFKSKVKKFFCG